MRNKEFLFGLAASLAFVGAGCTINGNLDVDEKKPDPVACTMDAKQCPDGSYVGRQGPNCEFAPCPGPAVDGVIDIKAN